jgi:hypothetical protein
MAFVDGTNFLIELGKEIDAEIRADSPPEYAIRCASSVLGVYAQYRTLNPIRKFWFGSYVGNDETELALRRTIRSCGFEPVLFHKKKNGSEKGVDIALAKEMLVNAFNRNFDIGVLVAGDQDYHDLVQETKRYGQTIEGAFFSHGLSEPLRLAFDSFHDLSSEKYRNSIHDCVAARATEKSQLAARPHRRLPRRRCAPARQPAVGPALTLAFEGGLRGKVRTRIQLDVPTLPATRNHYHHDLWKSVDLIYRELSWTVHLVQHLHRMSESRLPKIHAHGDIAREHKQENT